MVVIVAPLRLLNIEKATTWPVTGFPVSSVSVAVRNVSPPAFRLVDAAVKERPAVGVVEPSPAALVMIKDFVALEVLA